MICQHCFKKKATIFITHVVDNKHQELHLCQSCADELDVNKTVSNLPQIFTGLIFDILKYKAKESGLPVRHSESGLCPVCKSSWEDFKRTGFLGCDTCYVTFHDQIEKIINRLQGVDRHIGQRPKSKAINEPEESRALLEMELKQAVKNEEYEKAAELRDKIRSIKNE